MMPSFLLGEYLFYACAALAFTHAWKQGAERRKHLLAWFGALLAGTANDMIFMALPLVDNFWQAQGTIMLTPRLPLYIPCVYVCFMYFPTVSVWRLGLPPLARAALTGLAGSLFYAPYDITGAKFCGGPGTTATPRSPAASSAPRSAAPCGSSPSSPPSRGCSARPPTATLQCRARRSPRASRWCAASARC
ncbi:hypothetical protein [Nannocystis pusilla]|uniref:DUF7802 domain-containing protein n=1 Tax=Nannocystis pusilla TaxID=889268 RepID=UPI003B7FD1D2